MLFQATDTQQGCIINCALVEMATNGRANLNTRFLYNKQVHKKHEAQIRKKG